MLSSFGISRNSSLMDAPAPGKRLKELWLYVQEGDIEDFSKNCLEQALSYGHGRAPILHAACWVRPVEV